MKFDSNYFMLSSGENIFIREAIEDDAEFLIHNTKSYIKDSNTIVLENFDPSIEEEKKWINSFVNSFNNLLLVAEFDGKIIGNIEVKIPNLSKTKHTGVIGMGILKEWRNKGVGSFLLKNLIDWSKKSSEIEILWLQVFATNSSGISLYKKMGFNEDGRQHNFIKLNENEYTDNIIMSLSVKGIDYET
ncbi:MAG: GNAT family N-acetyltransferase [Cyanobacteriota bacterium]